MSGKENIRIDKFLWAVRIFKTRSLASEACRKGRIVVNNIQVKPSRIITANETITVKRLPLVHSYSVIEPIENRVSAKLVHLYVNEEEKAKLSNRELSGFGYRNKGTGRPTKKERRNIDKLKEGLDIS